MSDWYSSMYKGFILASIVSFIIAFFTKGSVSLSAYIAGYSVLILGIMMILLILFNKILGITQGQTSFQILYTILMTTGPFILMLSVVAFILYLMITYKNKILEEYIPQGYYSFSNIFIILLFIQLYIVYTKISTDKFESTGKISSVTSSILYLLGVLDAICSIIIFTILKYFSTDGFRTL
jgi:lysylphosphatidylglycerol synthetase-like protein (DUF2156 family)